MEVNDRGDGKRGRRVCVTLIQIRQDRKGIISLVQSPACSQILNRSIAHSFLGQTFSSSMSSPRMLIVSILVAPPGECHERVNSIVSRQGEPLGMQETSVKCDSSSAIFVATSATMLATFNNEYQLHHNHIVFVGGMIDVIATVRVCVFLC